MKGRKPNKLEQKWLDDICETGCIACLNLGYLDSPAMPHHMDGKTKPGVHFLTIPLCHPHHQGLPDSRHQNKTQFEAKHGTEQELLEQVQGMLD